MSYYPALKQRLTCREVAPRYGLKVNASGTALCPFHDEHSPSLKLSRGFHCFGCGAQGDVITFVSRLFGIPPGKAAQKLSADFGIPAGNHSRGPPTARTELETWISYAKEILHGYYDLLIDWKQRYCPKALDEEWHPLFIEALQRQADIRQLIFELEFGTTEEVKTVYEHYRKVVKKIGKRIHGNCYISQRENKGFGKQRKSFYFSVKNAPTGDEAKSESNLQYGKGLHRLTNWCVNRCIRRVNL